MNKILISLALFISGCSGLNLHVKDNNPNKSFVKLTRNIFTIVCHDQNGIRECVELKPVTFNASGFIVGENEDHTHIITAGHFCQPVEKDKNKLEQIFKENNIPEDAEGYFEDATFVSNVIVNDYKGTPYFSRLIAYEVDNTDLCLVQTDRKMDFSPLTIADEEPEIGERLMMASAPLGIHYPGMVIILDGFYGGFMWHPFFNKPASSITNMPLLPGSSGAGILNSDNEVVSVAMATNMMFPHEAYGVPLSQIQDFVDKHLRIERNYFSEWLNGLFD